MLEFWKGGQKTVKRSEKVWRTNKQTDRHTDIATYRKHRPKGRCFENLVSNYALVRFVKFRKSVQDLCGNTDLPMRWYYEINQESIQHNSACTVQRTVYNASTFNCTLCSVRWLNLQLYTVRCTTAMSLNIKFEVLFVLCRVRFLKVQT